MVGRAARGRPWLLAAIAAGLAGRLPPAPPGRGARGARRRSLRETVAFYGPGLGVRVARKHVGWYLDHVPGTRALARRLLALADPLAVERALRDEFADLACMAAAA